MSIKVQSHVWEHSPAKGGELLILLAIADFADDNGVAWPSIDTLAQKARLSTRQTQYNVRALIASGQITVQENAGPHGTHRYRVLGVQRLQGAKSARVQSATPRGAICDTQGVQPIAPEPSIEPPVNRHSLNTPKPPTKRKGELSEVQQSRFDRWYQSYPRKVSKADAVKAWANIDPPPTNDLTDQMIAKVEEWAGSQEWSDPQYIPHPATWLNKGRWTDGPPTPLRGPGGLTIYQGGRGEKVGRDGKTDSERGWREDPGPKGWSADEAMRMAMAMDQQERERNSA